MRRLRIAPWRFRSLVLLARVVPRASVLTVRIPTLLARLFRVRLIGLRFRVVTRLPLLVTIVVRRVILP